MILEGASEISRCPYCQALAQPWHQPGTSVVFLSGFDAGKIGIVVADRWGTCPSDRFLVQMPYEREGVTRMVNPLSDLTIDKDKFFVPSWMPSLSIEDNSSLHRSIGPCVTALTMADDRVDLSSSLRGVIETCWRRRLPITGAEIWRVVAAHAPNHDQKDDVVSRFDFGIGLLTYTHGRPAVKCRRMAPMSKGHYLTKRAQQLRRHILGHD